MVLEVVVPILTLGAVHPLLTAVSAPLQFLGDFVAAGLTSELVGIGLKLRDGPDAVGNLGLMLLLGIFAWATQLFALSRGGGRVDPALEAWAGAMLVAFWRVF